jgi:NAD(P)-dependent dehydrogenase (short-subunit alcohol dehydrogenase family)
MIALITGVSGNLGSAIAQKFLDEGFRVVGSVIHDDPVQLKLEHPQFETVAVDLGDEAAAEKFVRQVVEKYGRIDVAVLTVGGFAAGTIPDTGIKDILHQFTLNFQTTYQVARPVFQQMVQQARGRIFLTGARTGLDMRFSKGTIAYGLSKSLIFRLAELMNEEGKDHNVVTSVIAPSTIDTPQNRNAMPKADFGSWVRAEDIATTIHFYCSEDASALREPVLKFYGGS